MPDIYTKTADNNDAELVVIGDETPESSGYRIILSGINHAAAVELDLDGKKITRYYFISTDADIRAVEDATDITEANTWLQAGVTHLAAGQLFCFPPVLANEPSRLRKNPRGNYLTSVWFLADANVSGKTVTFVGE